MTSDIASVVNAYSTDLPHLRASFAEACAISPKKRLAWAKEQRKTVFRDGWFYNTPVGARGDAETVDAHARHLVELVHRYFPKDVRDQAARLAEYHDDHEVIAHAVIDGVKRDLNPSFNKTSYAITNDDKKAIEFLARAVLFESEPDLRQALDAYPSYPDLATRLFSDLDKICVMWRCAEYVESGRYDYADFKADYWDFWTPDTARARCAPFISNLYVTELWPRIEKLEAAAQTRAP